MNKERVDFYKEKIDAAGQWYQPIEFVKGKLMTKSKYDFASSIHGINKWKLIRRNLPKNLRGKKILDMGCASGLYSMLCAREGANVVGLELDKEGYEQSIITRDIFSELDGINYSNKFKIIRGNLMNFEWKKYPKFDFVLALNILYWITTPFEKIDIADRKDYSAKQLKELVEKIGQHSKKILVQSDENKYWVRKKKNTSLEATNSKKVVELLKKCAFKNIRIDKPIILKSIWRTFLKRKPEVDFKKPIYYARPIITGDSPE